MASLVYFTILSLGLTAGLSGRPSAANAPHLYFTDTMQVTLQLGEPPQKILANVDTRHWETFAVSASVFNCSELFPNDKPCSYTKSSVESPLFDLGASHSAHKTGQTFRSQYDSVGNMTGAWISDVVTLMSSLYGDSGLESIDGFHFGLLNYSQVEPIVGLAHSQHRPALSITGLLKSKGLINTEAYSIWIHSRPDDFKPVPDTNTIGTVIFGNVDTNGYQGNLFTVPMIDDDTYNGTLVPATVLHGLAYASQSDPEVPLAVMAQRFELVYNTEASTNDSLVPQELYNVMKSQVMVTEENNLTLADCNTLSTFRWNFSGAVIDTPVSAFLDLTRIFTGDEGMQLCPLALRPGKDVRFTTSVLRSFYSVVDFNQKLIGLAQAMVRDSGEEKLVRITEGGLPGAKLAPNYGSTRTTSEIQTNLKHQVTAPYSGAPANSLSLAVIMVALLAQII